MVEYHEWVGIVRSVAEDRGADTSDFESNSAIVKVAASIWNDRKDEILRASVQDATKIAEEEVAVS